MEIERKVFLSYKREDQSFASKLKADLEAEGIFSWIDVNGIQPGLNWDHEVEQALKKAEIVLVLLTPDSVTSANVMDEVSYALSSKKRVIPVMVRNCEVPFRLHRRQRIDLTSDYSTGLKQLIETINNEKPSLQVKLPKRKSLVQKDFIVPLLVASFVLMVDYLSAFKGIVYTQWEVAGDSVLRLTFVNKSPQPDSNFMVTATIKDTASFGHDFLGMLTFDKIPTNPIFKNLTEDFGSGQNKKQRTALQPILENGNYIAMWPLLQKQRNSSISPADIEVKFEAFDYRLNTEKQVNARLLSWYDHSAITSAGIFILVLLVGIFTQLLIQKNKKI